MSYNQEEHDNVSIENNFIDNSPIDDGNEESVTNNSNNTIILEDDTGSNGNTSNNQSSISNAPSINTFINETDTILSDVSEDTIFNANPSKWNCTFCPYKEDKENCGEGIIY